MTAPELRRLWTSPEDPIRLLMLTNELVEGTEYGFRAEFERLLSLGVLADYRCLAPRAAAAEGRDWYAEATASMREVRPNVLLVLSPGQLSVDAVKLRQLLELCSPTVLYWEGDAWGRGKPITSPMRRWAEVADVLFSVSGGLTAQAFGRSGPASLRLIAHTYCHMQFASAEEKPPDASPPPDDVAVIGSSSVRFGMLARVPGGAARARLVRQLQRLDPESTTLAIYGKGWRGDGVRGPVAYRDQIERLRAARVSVNWDHFPRHPHYASDRLPISLLAGRVHVTTRHPGVALYGNDGLVEVDSVSEVVEAARHLLTVEWQELAERGRAGWEFARHRLSDREAARFMLRAVDRRVPAPPAQPWDQIEALTPKRASVLAG